MEIRDREAVLTDTRRKVGNVWPGCHDNQVIPFSSVEAKFMQERGVLSPKYHDLLEKIKLLLPEAYETVILKGYR